MNIFYLDRDPEIAAKAHCDKHVVKMILESAQILCTVINEKAGYQVTPYKSTHKNHPCTLWAGASVSNAHWLVNLTYYLDAEFRRRFNHEVSHKSFQMLVDVKIIDLIYNYLPPTTGLTPPALAMPEQFRLADPVESYRLYYRLDKQHLLTYTKTERPEWLEN
jgi:hypothetical protein